MLSVMTISLPTPTPTRHPQPQPELCILSKAGLTFLFIFSFLGGNSGGWSCSRRAGFQSEGSEMGWGKSAPKGPPLLSNAPLSPPISAYPHYLNGQLGGGFGWLGEAQDGECGEEDRWHTERAPLGSAAPHPQAPQAPHLMENGIWALEIEKECGEIH